MTQPEIDKELIAELLGEPGVREALHELAQDPAGLASRIGVCEAISDGLRELGRMLWVSGALIGPDRVEGASPWDFGDDGVVGVAVVAQTGGELASGAIALLKDGNRYASAALTRQLLEVEYLAHAFAEDHEAAREWLRTDRERRLEFWSPKKLRKRAGGVFLPKDYGHHCEIGGHPSPRGMTLLPNHQGVAPEALWIDLAMHLVSAWGLVLRAAEWVLGQAAAEEWERVAQVSAVVEHWRQTDGYAAAMRDLREMRGDQP